MWLLSSCHAACDSGRGECAIAGVLIRDQKDVSPFQESCYLGDCASLASQSQNPDSKFPSSVELFAMDDAAAGLVGGKHQHLGYLYMLGSLYGIEHHIGHIISGKRLDALINLVGTVLVAVKTHP